MGCGFHTSRQQQQWQPLREPVLLHSVLAQVPSEQSQPGGAYPHLDFDRSVNPISIRGVDYAHDFITNCPSVFSVLPTALSPDF